MIVITHKKDVLHIHIIVSSVLWVETDNMQFDRHGDRFQVTCVHDVMDASNLKNYEASSQPHASHFIPDHFMNFAFNSL